jgi:PA domain
LNANHVRRPSALAILFIVVALSFRPAVAHAAATIAILNTDAPNVGFNDPTPAAPVGGNPGTTLGQQRLNVFQAAANIWGANLNSLPVIVIDAAWLALSCNATSAVLGSAGATQVFSSAIFPFANTWYNVALANKLFGAQIDPTTPQIRARFNVNLGQPGCLTGIFFYLGLDNNHGANIDLETVLLHEFAHGLGFQAFVTQAGSNIGPPFQPSIFTRFALDTTTNKIWSTMSDAERAASSINTRKVVWTGANVTGSVNSVLFPGTPRLLTAAPASLAGTYLVGLAQFGPALSSPGVSGEVMPLSGAGNQLLGCDPFSALNVAAVAAKVALIDRGVCGFAVKTKNAQDAGAVGVIIVNNAAGSPPPGMGGVDPTISIPSVMITQADGASFRGFLKFRSRTHSGMFVTVGVDQNIRQGADAAGRVMLYTPNPYVPGSSVSHWDTSAFANLLMEPAINGDLTHNLDIPFDLTLRFLLDLGW